MGKASAMLWLEVADMRKPEGLAWHGAPDMIDLADIPGFLWLVLSRELGQ